MTASVAREHNQVPGANRPSAGSGSQLAPAHQGGAPDSTDPHGSGVIFIAGGLLALSVVLLGAMKVVHDVRPLPEALGVVGLLVSALGFGISAALFAGGSN